MNHVNVFISSCLLSLGFLNFDLVVVVVVVGGGGAARLKIIYKGVQFTRPRPDRAVEFTGCVSEFSVLV